MDSFQFWLYVIIGVIYLISRMRKKQQVPPEESEEREFEGRSKKPRTESQSTAPKAFTFEELLREITESKTQPRQAAPAEVVDYDDDIASEEQDLEDVDYDYKKESKIYETYEEAKKQAFLRPSLEETMKVEDTVVGFGKFKEFESKQQRNLAREYLMEFRNPESMKRAVVLSEILKQKF